MSLLLLAAVLLLSLFIIPLGLPGTWLMVIAAWAYNYLVPGDPVGTWTILGTAVLALIAEGLELSLAASYTRKYGGSRRASWGAVIGGVVGAIVGIPIPLIGSMIGVYDQALASCSGIAIIQVKIDIISLHRTGIVGDQNAVYNPSHR